MSSVQKKADLVIRPVKFKAAIDFDAITHVCSKGKTYELPIDHARRFQEEGKGEIVGEVAIRSTENTEKRG